MELAYDSRMFQELTTDDMMDVNGGMTLIQAIKVAAIALAIIGVAMTPYGLVAAVGSKAVIYAAGKGVGALIGLIASVT